MNAIAVNGRKLVEAFITFLPAPQDGWPLHAMVAKKLQSPHWKGLLEQDVHSAMWIINEKSNYGAHDGTPEMQPTDKPAVAENVLKVALSFRDFVRRRYPEQCKDVERSVNFTIFSLYIENFNFDEHSTIAYSEMFYTFADG